jgi:hypothetical protein
MYPLVIQHSELEHGPLTDDFPAINLLFQMAGCQFAMVNNQMVPMSGWWFGT